MLKKGLFPASEGVAEPQAPPLNVLIRQELEWAVQERLLRQRIRPPKFLHPKPAPVQVPFETCRKLQSKKKIKKCSLESCSPRTIELAMPKKRKVLHTWKELNDYLPVEIVERFKKILSSTGHNLDIKQAAHHFKTLDQKKRKKHARNRSKPCDRLQDEIQGVAKAITSFFRDSPLPMLNYDQMLLSNQLMDELNKRQLTEDLNRKSSDSYKKTLVEICDKMAAWMDHSMRFIDFESSESDDDNPEDEEEEEFFSDSSGDSSDEGASLIVHRAESADDVVQSILKDMFPWKSSSELSENLKLIHEEEEDEEEPQEEDDDLVTNKTSKTSTNKSDEPPSSAALQQAIAVAEEQSSIRKSQGFIGPAANKDELDIRRSVGGPYDSEQATPIKELVNEEEQLVHQDSEEQGLSKNEAQAIEELGNEVEPSFEDTPLQEQANEDEQSSRRISKRVTPSQDLANEDEHPSRSTSEGVTLPQDLANEDEHPSRRTSEGSTPSQDLANKDEHPSRRNSKDHANKNTNLMLAPPSIQQEAGDSSFPIKTQQIGLVHAPNTICCLSLQNWAVTLVYITFHTQKWTQYVRQVIEKLRQFVLLTEKDKHDADWSQFFQDLNDKGVTWQSYTQQIKDLSNKITEINKGNKRPCKCVQNHSDQVARDTLEALGKAVGFAEDWQRHLQDIMQRTSQINVLPLVL